MAIFFSSTAMVKSYYLAKMIKWHAFELFIFNKRNHA